MFRTRLLVILFLLTFCRVSWAFGEISFGAQLGQAGLGITNDDGTVAYYDGLAFQGNTGVNFFRTKKSSLGLNFNLNYLDIENRANSSIQRESGRHLGLGVDLSVRFYRFSAGYDYFYEDAKHYWVGNLNNDYNNFKYIKTGWHAGLDFNVSKSTRLGLIYSNHTATLPKSEMRSTSDLKLEESTFYIRVSVSTDETIADFFSYIFGAKNTGR